jgi:DNA-binding CsgD family transcriptional regulator/PAS domain-containing protein
VASEHSCCSFCARTEIDAPHPYLLIVLDYSVTSIYIRVQTSRRYPLSELDKIQSDGEELSRRDCSEAAESSLNYTLRSLTNRLGNSTVAVALFDKQLRCETLNGSFASINGLPVQAQIGKNILQLLGKDAATLEPAFRAVWDTGESLSNFEWTGQFPSHPEAGRWHVNVYPIKDVLGEIRLIAATFSEVTKRSSVEQQLDRLTDRFRADVLKEPSLFGEEFAELSARTLDLVRRSVDLLKISASLRCYLSETRMETGLESADLFLEGTRALELIPRPDLPTVGSGLEMAVAPELPVEGEQHVGNPSPRERQILHLLADGKSNKEIGVVLEISARTVESYRARIMVKLDLHSTAALVRYAIRNNIADA